MASSTTPGITRIVKRAQLTKPARRALYDWWKHKLPYYRLLEKLKVLGCTISAGDAATWAKEEFPEVPGMDEDTWADIMGMAIEDEVCQTLLHQLIVAVRKIDPENKNAVRRISDCALALRAIVTAEAQLDKIEDMKSKATQKRVEMFKKAREQFELEMKALLADDPEVYQALVAKADRAVETLEAVHRVDEEDIAIVQ